MRGFLTIAGAFLALGLGALSTPVADPAACILVCDIDGNNCHVECAGQNGKRSPLPEPFAGPPTSCISECDTNGQNCVSVCNTPRKRDPFPAGCEKICSGDDCIITCTVGGRRQQQNSDTKKRQQKNSDTKRQQQNSDTKKRQQQNSDTKKRQQKNSDTKRSPAPLANPFPAEFPKREAGPPTSCISECDINGQNCHSVCTTRRRREALADPQSDKGCHTTCDASGDCIISCIGRREPMPADCIGKCDDDGCTVTC